MESLARELKGNGPLGELTAYPPPCLLDASQRDAIRLPSFAMLRWAKASLCVMIFLEKGKALFISGFSFTRHTWTEHLLCSEARYTFTEHPLCAGAHSTLGRESSSQEPVG